MPDMDEGLQNIDRMNRAISDLREPLGELTLQFAGLEDEVTLAINAVLRLTFEEGCVLEAVMRDFRSRIRLLQGLINLSVKDKGLKKLGLRVVSLIYQANDDRNNLLHDAWNSYSPEKDTLTKIRYILNEKRGLSQPPLHDLPRKLVHDSVRFIARVGFLVSDWRYRFCRRDTPGAVPDPLPEKCYQGSPLCSHIKELKKK
jgi:hypothetical protein